MHTKRRIRRRKQCRLTTWRERTRSSSDSRADKKQTDDVERKDQIVIRLARRQEADACADLWLRSRRAAFPAVPPPTEEDMKVPHWMPLTISMRKLWVAESDGLLLAVMCLYDEDGFLDQLYGDPVWTGQGIGSRLLAHAKTLNPSGLELRVFKTNLRAQRFYERHGFVHVEMADDNEEMLDVAYRWSG
jgi:GNAT superfamily N-acetyltransferase